MNLGPNWECGQETSLRMLHVLIAAHLTGCAREPEPGLMRFVREHVESRERDDFVRDRPGQQSRYE